jgi:copper chaperone
MKQYQFKTNINCGGCVARVTPVFNQQDEIKEWNVDTQNPDKVLTVKTENMAEEEVLSLVKKAGFNAEKLA